MLAQQAQKARLIAARLAKTQCQRTLRAVIMAEMQRAGPRQKLPRLQPAAQGNDQPLTGKGQPFGVLYP